jgi:hypothetical protein
MYYIYHIPGVKVGCTKNLTTRMKRQGFSEYEILETHTDIDIASNREIELQNQYGYIEPSRTNYKQHIEFGKAGQAACKGKPGKGAQFQIKNKIGMFGYSKEERLAINIKASLIGAQRAKEVLSKPIDMFDFKTGKFIKSFTSKNQAYKQFNICNIGAVLNGIRNHSKGYTFKYKTL